MRLHMDHYTGSDNGRTHAPVPFFVSSRGYGVLINSARYIDLWVGTAVRKGRMPRRNKTVIQIRPGLHNLIPTISKFWFPHRAWNWFFFAGITMQDVVRRYNLYNGGGAFASRVGDWGSGTVHRLCLPITM